MLNAGGSAERSPQPFNGTGWTPGRNGQSSRGSAHNGGTAGIRGCEGQGLGQSAMDQFGGSMAAGGHKVGPSEGLQANAYGVDEVSRRNSDELLATWPHDREERFRQGCGAKRRRSSAWRHSGEHDLQAQLELALDYLAAAMPAGGGASYYAEAAAPAGAAVADDSSSPGTAPGPPAAVLSALAAAALPRLPSDRAERLPPSPFQRQQRPSSGAVHPDPEDGERALSSAEVGLAQPAIAAVTSFNARARDATQAPDSSAEALQRLLAGSGPLLLRMAGADASPLPPVTRVVWLASGKGGGHVPLVLVSGASGAAPEQQQ